MTEMRSGPRGKPLPDGGGTDLAAENAALRTALRDVELDDGARLAMGELRHRTKNLLAIIQSLTRHTLRDGVPLAEARETLDRRLTAMSRAVDLLLKTEWTATSLEALAAAALAHRDSYGPRVAVAGPPIEIGANAALTLTMAMHELESNAIKHGALARDGGAVALSWHGDTDRLFLVWRESGCDIAGPPRSHGFGMRLIRDVPARRFDARVALDWRREGLCWTLEVERERLHR